MYLKSNLLVKLVGQCTVFTLNPVYLSLFVFFLRKQQTVYFDMDRDQVNSLNAMIFQELRPVRWRDDY